MVISVFGAIRALCSSDWSNLYQYFRLICSVSEQLESGHAGVACSCSDWCGLSLSGVSPLELGAGSGGGPGHEEKLG